MASNGAASGGPALHATLMEAEVACAVAHLKKARAHGAAAGQSLDHTALDFLDTHAGMAVAAGGKKPPPPPKAAPKPRKLGALCRAAKAGDIGKIKRLIDAGAETDERDSASMTPLMLASV